MERYLSLYKKHNYPLALLLLLLPSLLLAEGLPSPEAVAYTFAQAYRSSNADMVVALQLFVESRNPAAARESERQAWVRQMQQWKIRSYRVDQLLARDQTALSNKALLPQKKLVVVYESQRQKEPSEQSYLIVWQTGGYYLMPVQQER